MTVTKRHYWLRSDFDELMGVLAGSSLPDAGSADSSCSLAYPKSTKGAVAELKLRGLECDAMALHHLVDKGIVTPKPGHTLVNDRQGNVGIIASERLVFWGKADIDAAAEWLYDNDYWGHWTHFCWVADLRFGQAVQAHRYMCARHNLGFSIGFDAIGVVSVIEPPENPNDYARVRFYPKGTKVEVGK
jgi:hypothetical protein